MDEKSKRLSAAKKKLQQYKSQRQKQEREQECSKSDTLSKSQESLSSLINEEEEHDEGVSNSILSQSPSVPLSCNQQQLHLDEGSNESVQVFNDMTTNVSFLEMEQQKDPHLLSAELMTEPVAVSSVLSVSLNNNVLTSESSESEIQLPEVKLFSEKSTQCESDESAVEVSQNMNDVIDNLQYELSKLRQENSTLMSRESELITQLEAGERLVRDLRKEVNQFKQLGNQQKQLEELQDAIVVVSKSKMTIAEELNNEQDKNKELLHNLNTFENELKSLRSENATLWADMNNLRSTLEQEMKKNQILEDERRHYSVHVEQLQAKLNNSVETHNTHHDHDHHHDSHEGHSHSHGHHEGEGEKEHSHSHSHGSECTEHHHNGHSNKDDHGDHHHHDDDEHSVHDEQAAELVEMNKTLKRLEWENTTYKAELAKLGPVTMTMKQLEPRVLELQDKNSLLKEEVDRLEHLVIQLQGENDTIGDYITLYQSQRIALRQHAKENDRLVAALSKERNDLLQKLSELNNAVDQLAKQQQQQQQQQNGSVIEEQIRDLIGHVNSKVNETFSCSTCSSSRLMTV